MNINLFIFCMMLTSHFSVELCISLEKTLLSHLQNNPECEQRMSVSCTAVHTATDL